MPGRNDFGILRSSFLTDERALRAAALYVERGLASPTAAFGAVAGHVALLGLWAMKETDDGVLLHDGVTMASVALVLPRSGCQQVLAALLDAGLLRPADNGVDGLYLVGFRDCYGPILDEREVNRDYARERRAEAAAKRAAAAAKRAEKLAARNVDPTVGPTVTPTVNPDGHPDSKARQSGVTVGDHRPAVPAVPTGPTEPVGTARATPTPSPQGGSGVARNDPQNDPQIPRLGTVEPHPDVPYEVRRVAPRQPDGSPTPGVAAHGRHQPTDPNAPAPMTAEQELAHVAAIRARLAAGAYPGPAASSNGPADASPSADSARTAAGDSPASASPTAGPSAT